MAVCEATDAKLATLLSDAEVEEVAELINEETYYWIGGHCSGTSYELETGIHEMMVYI